MSLFSQIKKITSKYTIEIPLMREYKEKGNISDETFLNFFMDHLQELSEMEFPGGEAQNVVFGVRIILHGPSFMGHKSTRALLFSKDVDKKKYAKFLLQVAKDLSEEYKVSVDELEGFEYMTFPVIIEDREKYLEIVRELSTTDADEVMRELREQKKLTKINEMIELMEEDKFGDHRTREFLKSMNQIAGPHVGEDVDLSFPLDVGEGKEVIINRFVVNQKKIFMSGSSRESLY